MQRCSSRSEHDHALLDRLWYVQVTAKEDLLKVRSISKKRREGNVRFRSGAAGKQQAEALLDTKAHRRVSRTKSNQDMRSLIFSVEDDQDEYL